MKSFCSRFALAFIGLTLSACAVAQSYPTRAIRLIVPFAPGGGSDAIARMLADKMGPELGQSVVVENKPGASSIIGVDATAKAPADGYTLVMANSSITSNPWLYKLPYDLQADLAAVTMIAKAPQLLVANPKAPFKTVGELVSYAKANPGMATIGTAGAGQISHLAAEVLQQTRDSIRAIMMIRAFRMRGHLQADLDPL
ncbi:MAG: tripartite tricarboxylate transporter substrate-binding protein, partial [Pollutimonas bauzanensis]